MLDAKCDALGSAVWWCGGVKYLSQEFVGDDVVGARATRETPVRTEPHPPMGFAVLSTSAGASRVILPCSVTPHEWRG
jgi:hypothetical protein